MTDSLLDDGTPLGLLRAMVAAQTRGEEAVQDVVEAALRGIGCEVERVTYTPRGIALKREFASASAKFHQATAFVDSGPEFLAHAEVASLESFTGGMPGTGRAQAIGNLK